MQPGGILALDLSTRCGWAYGLQGADKPAFGVWMLPTLGSGLGRVLGAFENELLDAIAVHAPSLMIVEAPLPPVGQTATSTMELQLGLNGMAAASAWRHEIVFKQAAASSVRLEVIGTGRFARGQAKTQVMAYCRSIGWDVPDDNAADAALLWRYSVIVMARHAANATRAA